MATSINQFAQAFTTFAKYAAGSLYCISVEASSKTGIGKIIVECSSLSPEKLEQPDVKLLDDNGWQFDRERKYWYAFVP